MLIIGDTTGPLVTKVVDVSILGIVRSRTMWGVRARQPSTEKLYDESREGAQRVLKKCEGLGKVS